MAIEGQLQEVGLADICQLLAMGRKTGCLSVTDRSNFGYIFFEDGVVIHATVLNRPERLGEILVRNGLVSAEALNRARQEAVGETGTHYSHILLDREELERADLERFARIEVEESVYRLFDWEEGSFHFRSGETPDPSIPVRVSIPAEILLLEGARRADEWTQIRQEIPSPQVIFKVVLDPRTTKESDLTPQQARALDLVDGKRTVGEITRASGMVGFEVARALYDMVREGWIERTGEGSTDPPTGQQDSPARRHLELGKAFQASGMLEEAEREFQGLLETEPEHEEALSRLAVIALRTERPSEAIEYLDRADAVGGVEYSRLRNRALALEVLDQVPAALEVLDGSDAIAGNDPGLHLARGIVLCKLEQYEESLESFERYRKLLGQGEIPPPMYYAYFVLAAEAGRRMELTLRVGREGLAQHPWSGPILVNLGAVLERRGETAAAEALYLRAVGESGTPPQAHRNLGDLALRRGDRASARAHYERAVRLKPDLGDQVYFNLGKLFYEEGDRETARTLWQRALQLNPDNQVARTNLDSIAARTGR
jgi:tetratricopeptide (TPR) repeat protein